jgi:hypothetical protein
VTTTSSVRSGSSHARNEPDKIPAINRKYGAAYSVASLPVDDFEKYNYIPFPVPVTKVHYLCYRVNKQHLYQKFINDRFVCC